VGDFTAAEVLAELRAFGPLAAVCGNMDEPALMAALPERLVAEAEGLRIGLVHDAGPRRGRHERLRAAFPDCDLIVYGHSHEPEVALTGATWIVNPGSPTERRRARAHTMAVVEAGVPRLVELGP
jgi:putative phosphoesterase